VEQAAHVDNQKSEKEIQTEHEEEQEETSCVDC